MASIDYTEKQLAEHLDRFAKDGTLPDGSLFDPAAHVRGEPILRKMTAEERRDAGLPPASEKTDNAGKTEG